MSKSSDSLRLKLRQETHELHAGLERALDLLSPALVADDYRRLLERFYGFYNPLEAAMRQALGGDATEIATGRWKTPAIAADLASLGQRPADVAQLPAASDVPRLASRADVTGALYVVEGSTLGGAVLSRHFAERWGLTREHGLAFLHFYGDQTAAMWQRYLAHLAEFDNERDAGRVIAAATATFRALAAWLTTPSAGTPAA